MQGIVTGLAKNMKKPIADGIVSGIQKKKESKMNPDVMKCTPSPTKFGQGVFGAGATPQGQGDGTTGSGAVNMKKQPRMFGGMKLAY